MFFKYILKIPVPVRNTRLKLAFAIPVGASAAVTMNKERHHFFYLIKQVKYCSIIECCDILINLFAQLFSVIDFCNKEIWFDEG